jgi:uncharacterized protein YdhG (YjbR/CyaY superfamily)
MWKCPKCQRDFKNAHQEHQCGNTPATIDEYIAAQPEEVQPILTKIRQTIREAAPDAKEKISWRMPTFWQGENLIHFAAFKKHIGIYPGDLSLVPFEDKLVGYHTTKGAIQFPIDKPVDYELIADITRFRITAVSSVEKRSSGKKKQQQNKTR